MTKLFGAIGATITSYIGWAVGEPFGLMTAWLLSAIAGGVGFYYGRKIGRHYEG